MHRLKGIPVVVALGAIALALSLTGATITSLGTLPDPSGGVFTQANHDQINSNVTTSNTNFSNVQTAIGSATGTSGTGTTLCLTVGCSLTLTNATAFPPALAHLNIEKTFALADLQTLNSVPFQVIAPPGATSMIQMGSCTLNLTRGSAAFTGGGTVSIGYDTGSSPATNGTIASTVFTTFAASHAVVVLPVAVAVTATTSLANKGIYITAASADFASGTGATGQLNCDYSIVTGVA